MTMPMPPLVPPPRPKAPPMRIVYSGALFRRMGSCDVCGSSTLANKLFGPLICVQPECRVHMSGQERANEYWAANPPPGPEGFNPVGQPETADQRRAARHEARSKAVENGGDFGLWYERELDKYRAELAKMRPKVLVNQDRIEVTTMEDDRPRFIKTGKVINRFRPLARRRIGVIPKRW